MGLQKTVNINVTTTEELWPYQVVDEIQKVMEAGDGNHDHDSWKKQPVVTHLAHAAAHVKAAGGEALRGGVLPCTEDHLAHAFTRLMMAMAIERGYVKPTILDEEDTDA